jgi:hypothetical protein
MSTFLPRDDDHAPIPALRLKPDGAQTLTLSATAVRNTQAFSPRTRVIAVTATAAAFIRTGEAGVVASPADHYLPAGVYLYLSLGDQRAGAHRYIAAVEADGGGELHISELE